MTSSLPALTAASLRRLGGLLLVANLLFAVWATTRAVRAPQPSDVWLTTSVMLVPILACFARALLGGPRRAGAAWLGLAMTAYAAGNAIYVGWIQFDVGPQMVSAADIAYLAVYPCVAAAVVCLTRHQAVGFGREIWLDGSLGAAGAATALAVVLSPALVSTGGTGAVWVGAASAVADLLLVAIVFGMIAVRGLRGGSMWMWLGTGLAVYCSADVVYALRVASGTFVIGTLWAALWIVGLTIAAAGLWRPERPEPSEHSRSIAQLVIPALATLTAVVALVISATQPMPALVVVLATVTLGLAGLRTITAFRQVSRLSDAHRLAVTDDLTGLGNRRALFEYGERRLEALEPSDRIALMLIDLVNLKDVNDSLGHRAGDALLRESARRLAARVGSPHLLTRLGGDQFAVVFGLAPSEDSRRTAELLLDHLDGPFVLDGVRISVAGSVGIAQSSGNAVTMSELLRRADVAMFTCKAQHSQVEVYDAALDDDNRDRLETINDLYAALDGRQLVLRYQPKIDVTDGAITGVEALVRWQHPTRGLLAPDAFLPVVEHCGLMSAVTEQVLTAAIKQLAEWRAGGLDLTVAVNISASDLLDEHLADRIVAILHRHEVPFDAVELEITESVLMTDGDAARLMLERLRGLGLRIAVDDFGTGYCGLAYLRDLPIDVLKIDRTFIGRITQDPRSSAIVGSTIDLAHELDMEVVAEGVEDQQTLDMLETFECDLAQGFHFSRPVPAADLAALCRTPELTS